MRKTDWCGMQVLCASSESKDAVVPISPPEGSTPGDRVSVAGFEQLPLEEVREALVCIRRDVNCSYCTLKALQDSK